MTMATPRRRYPTSLSHNPAGPSRPPATKVPRPTAKPSSIDDEVPPLPVSDDTLPQLTSLEYLLRQAGYKETRVFTPESERVKPRLRQLEDDNGAAELADLYRSMGLDPNAPIHVRHLTKPAVPFRSSSSVLRNIALQDATAPAKKWEGEDTVKADSWWGTFGRTVGKKASSVDPPNDSPEPARVGLGLAKSGNGVRKAMSNWELRSSPRKEDMGSSDTPTKQRGVREQLELKWNRAPPKSLAGLFSPPTESAPLMPRFDDDALGSEDMYAYGLGDEDIPSDGSGSASSSLTQDSPVVLSTRAMSPPLLDAADVFADLGLIDPEAAAAARHDEITSVGRRILASTIDYDDVEDELDTPPSPASPPPVPALTFTMPTPIKNGPKPELPPLEPEAPRERASRETAPPKRDAPVVISRRQASPRRAGPHVDTPTKAARKPPQQREAKIRTTKSTPTLSSARRPRPPPLCLTSKVTSKATVAPPSIQNVSPIICDSVSNAAVDLPPLPMPPMPDTPPPTGGFSTLTLKARKSLSALRAYWAAEEQVAAEPEPTPDFDTLVSNSTVPVLTPRIDWEAQGFNAGWGNKPNWASHKSRDSTDTMAELDDPFLDSTGDIDYTKSFFYKPSTPPRDGEGSTYQARLAEPRRQRSIKSLKAALRMPVAPPVPAIPEKYKKDSGSTLSRTPPIPARRLLPDPPALWVHSPGAYEDGRPARPIDLEGEEFAARDVVNNWGKGVRKGRGKVPAGSRRRVRTPYGWD